MSERAVRGRSPLDAAASELAWFYREGDAACGVRAIDPSGGGGAVVEPWNRTPSDPQLVAVRRAARIRARARDLAWWHRAVLELAFVPHAGWHVVHVPTVLRCVAVGRRADVARCAVEPQASQLADMRKSPGWTDSREDLERCVESDDDAAAESAGACAAGVAVPRVDRGWAPPVREAFGDLAHLVVRLEVARLAEVGRLPDNSHARAVAVVERVVARGAASDAVRARLASAKQLVDEALAAYVDLVARSEKGNPSTARRRAA